MSSFILDLAALLRRQAASVGADDDYQSIRLAAHAFAAAIHLQETRGSGRMDTGRPIRLASKSEALRAFAALDQPSPETLYWTLIAGVLAIEHDLAPRGELRAPNRLAHPIPGSTTLVELMDGSRPALRGHVYHWLRPPSRWTRLVEDRRAAAPSMNRDPDPPSASLSYLAMLWDRGEPVKVTPVYRPSRFDVTPPGSFRIGLFPLSTEIGPRFRIADDGSTFTVDAEQGLQPAEAVGPYLDRVVDDCRHEALSILVLPELSIDLSARLHVLRAFERAPSLLGIVAGSFHIWPDGDGDPFNEAPSFVAGKPLWSHRKRGSFRVTDRQVRDMAAWFPEPLPSLAREIREGIRHGNELAIFDTAVGRIAIAICADAIATLGYDDELRRARPDLLLLPSMSPKTDEFRQFALRIAKFGVSCFYINSAFVTPGDEALAFVHLALPEPPNVPHTEVRWRQGRRQLERFDRTARRWRRRASGADAYLIGDGRGLVVDLARHWAPRSPKRR